MNMNMNISMNANMNISMNISDNMNLTISGLTPKKAGRHITMSANFPTSIDPTISLIPWAIAGFTVYFATYLLTR